ncbi:MAG: glycosyltransferase [Lentimicrobiaceae bacterium]|nr:glycosyltransferase [Lentimicrobiaceae bacterium]
MHKIGIISTCLPTQCGIATYSDDLINYLKVQYPFLNFHQFELSFVPKTNNPKRFVIRNYQAEDYIKAYEFINSSDIDLLDIQHEFKIFGKPDGENINILLENVTKPIVATLHTVNIEFPKNRESIFRKITSRSDLLFVFSEYAKNCIVDKYNVEESKVRVIPHGTPIIPFRLPQEIQERKYSQDVLIFVSSGHMRETKGYDIAINALNKIKNIIGNFHYYIIGEDHPQNETAKAYRKYLIKLINEFDFKDNITFINRYLPQEELIGSIQMADVCLLPYSKKEQSSSGVLALMIACGRPVIATPFQFANSRITTQSGIVTKTFLSDDFAKGILNLIKRKSSWDKIRCYNHTLGLSWNWINVVKQYYQGYEKAIIGYRDIVNYSASEQSDYK